MDLNFVISDKHFNGKAGYEVEFSVENDFNIHIERKAGGRFLIYQKSVSDGKYAIVDSVGYMDHKDVIDLDMTALVYPKRLRIVSESEVTKAVVTEAQNMGVGGGPAVISFTIDGVEFTAKEGMTWKEWCDSDYNTDEWFCEDPEYHFVEKTIVAGDGSAWGYTEWQNISLDGENYIYGKEIIKDGAAYQTHTNSDGIGGGGM